jgi:endonuclease YncB( thermonuclease family)
VLTALAAIAYRARGLAGWLREHPAATCALFAGSGVALVASVLLLPWTPEYSAPDAPSSASPVSTDASLVSRVIDGDTIELRGGQRVRLIGVDTPERGTALGDVARARVQELVEGRSLRLEYEAARADRFGRTLAHVWVGEELLAAVLAREGLATVALFATHTLHADRLLAAQDQARRDGRGLWAGNKGRVRD